MFIPLSIICIIGAIWFIGYAWLFSRPDPPPSTPYDVDRALDRLGVTVDHKG